jgi:adenylate cyclase
MFGSKPLFSERTLWGWVRRLPRAMRNLRVWRWAVLLIPVAFAFFHASGLGPMGWLTQLDLAYADTRLRLALPHTQDQRIVIVDVDEKSLAELGRWPWGRHRIAEMLDDLFIRQKVAVVGFDMVFAEPDNTSGLQTLERLIQRQGRNDPQWLQQLPGLRAELDHDARLARALKDRRVVLGYYFTSDRQGHHSGQLPPPVFDPSQLEGRDITFTRWNGYGANLPQLMNESQQRAGFFNSILDLEHSTSATQSARGDGLVRSLPLIAEFQGRHYESLVLAMFRAFTGDPAVQLVLPQSWLPQAYGGLEGVALEQGGHRIVVPVDTRVSVRIPFRGAPGPQGESFRYVSAVDVIQGRLPQGALAGAVVMVGSTAPGLFDLQATPVSQATPGVEVHASLLSALLDSNHRAPVPVTPDWARGFDVLMVVVLAALLLGLLPRGGVGAAVGVSLSLLVAVFGLNYGLYAQYHFLLPLAAQVMLIVSLFAGSMSWGYLVEARKKRSLAQLFGAYVPPELVLEMSQNPDKYDMRAETRELTVMFCDLRNFTRMSETLDPEALRQVVNRFFSVMTEIIQQHRGTLDKYIGDAIMAFWGAPLNNPHHAEHAVQAALQMAQAVHTLNASLQAQQLPPVQLGIGLNTGRVCVGDMGSDIRRSYTVMGDAVNLAARIESLTRHFGVAILAGEATQSGSLEAVVWLEVDRVRVKGKQQAVTLFTPLPYAQTQSVDGAEEMRLWSLALECFRQRQWEQASTQLHKLKTLVQREGNPPSIFYYLYDHLSARMKEQPAPVASDWDAAFEPNAIAAGAH